jgi:hypothetical protein
MDKYKINNNNTSTKHEFKVKYEGYMDGQTDGKTDGHGETSILPYNFVAGGIKKIDVKQLSTSYLQLNFKLTNTIQGLTGRLDFSLREHDE